MDISLFLARLMGIYLIIIGLAYLLKRGMFRAVMHDYFKSPALVVTAAVLNIILGLLLVLSHNVWEWGWHGVITFFGYAVLMKGLLNLFLPEWGKKISSRLVDRNFLIYAGLISLALGLYLGYYGFIQNRI